ncbi:MAG: SRPBCC family protein [Pseudomonadota bacterium]
MSAADTDLGEVTRDGETVTLVFRRRYARPIEKVWAALTVPERLTDWFAQASVDRLEVGGTIQLYFTGADYRSIARITVFEPLRAIAWTWSETDGSKASNVRFDLEPDGDGCRLTLTHSDLPAAESKGVLSGWHAHLEAVEDAADGVFTTWDTLIAREKRASPRYAARGDA